MKITILASSSDVLEQLKAVFQKNVGGDEFTFLQRSNHLLELDRMDLDSINILVVDSKQVEPADLKAIADIALNRMKPAVFYLCESYSEKQLIDLMRAGISEVIHLPLNGGSQALLDAVERIRKRHGVVAAYKTRAKVLSFISSKGGAGATFVASNVGYALAETIGKKVLLIDLHMQYGDAAFHLSNIPSSSSISDVVKEPYLDSMMIVSASIRITNNYFILQSPDHPSKSVGILPSHIANLIAVAGQDYDYIIFDLPNLLNAIVMQALDLSRQVFIVTNPTISYLKALTHMIGLFNELAYAPGKINIVLNRLDHIGGLNQKKVEEVITRPVQYTIAEDGARAVESISIGTPIVKMYSDEAISQSIQAIVASIAGEKIKSEKKSFLTSIFSQ
jgi:pilus assembly protein CpaE